MSVGKAWAGEQEFSNALKELNNHYPPHASKVKAVVNIAMRYPNDFKMVVFDVEKWMKKSNIADRIAGIFVMDSICRGSRAQHREKSKDIFSMRFLTRLNEILMLLNGASDSDLKSLLRVVEEWIRWDIFPLDRIQTALKGIRSPAIKIPTGSQPIESSDHESNYVVASGEYDPRSAFIRGPGSQPGRDIATVQPKESLQESLGKRKGIKYCPYRDGGNCPYGDKCRFSHADGKIYYPSLIKKHRRHSMIPYTSANHVLNDALASQMLSSDQLVQYHLHNADHHNPILHLVDDLVRVALPVEKYIMEYDGNAVDGRSSSVAVHITAISEEQFKKL